MNDYEIRAGDRLPPLELELINNRGVAAENLAAATAIELRYRPLAGGATIVRPMSLVDAATARVKYEWRAGETDTVGIYLAIVVVTFSDGRPESFPNNKFRRIEFTETL